MKRFLEDDDKDKLIKLGIEKAQETCSSDPPTERAVRLSELTHKFCMSTSQKEDRKKHDHPNYVETSSSKFFKQGLFLFLFAHALKSWVQPLVKKFR